jgi:hypothetical protein
LNPFYDPRRDEIARFAHAHPALVRIDRGEGHHDVGIGGGGLGDFVIRNPSRADFEFAVDGEHDEADLALAIIGDGLADRRALARLEVFVRGVFVWLPERVRRLSAGNLRVCMDVDRHEVVDVHCLPLPGWRSPAKRSRLRRRASAPPRPLATIASASQNGPAEAAAFYSSPGIVLRSAST